MRRITVFLLLVILSTAALAADNLNEPKKWNDTLRDIYIDGTLDRSPQILVADKQMMIIPKSGDALLFDTAAKEVARVDRAQFTFNEDRTAATSLREFARTRVAALTMATESTSIAHIDGKTWVIHPHQSHVGAMTEDDLWSTAPVWRSIHDHYTPDAEAVKRLRAIDKPLRLQVVFATWCGDSKRHVPRLLKAVHEAANPNLHVELYGIGNDFHTPIDFIQDHSIINVPIVMVCDGAIEIGRYIETPATANVESDIASIAEGKAPEHHGRYERQELLTRGTYELKDASGRANGTEEFEIYRAPEEGLLVHDRITRNGESIETWAGLDKAKAPDFAEVTTRTDAHVTRARFFASKGKWVASSRSDRSGIVEQTAELPASFTTPATPTLAWAIAGKNYAIRAGSETGLGRFDDERASITLDAALNLPREVKMPDGSTRVLHVAPAAAARAEQGAEE